MESIAVTKPGMGVLSQERLLLSPFGALAQAFSQEILDRARKEEGRWSYVPLDLLEEGEESRAAPAVPPVIQVDLHLVLEALRREKGESEQRRATERIVERILQIREVRDRPAAQSPARPRLEERTPASPMGVLRQNISQTLVQENRFGPFLLAEAAAKGREASKIPSAPGTLGRQAEALAQVLQDLREGVGPAAAETGRMNAVEGEARTRLPRAASVSRIMPREELVPGRSRMCGRGRGSRPLLRPWKADSWTERAGASAARGKKRHPGTRPRSRDMDGRWSRSSFGRRKLRRLGRQGRGTALRLRGRPDGDRAEAPPAGEIRSRRHSRSGRGESSPPPRKLRCRGRSPICPCRAAFRQMLRPQKRPTLRRSSPRQAGQARRGCPRRTSPA